MLADLARCMGLEHPEKDNVGNCFWIAKNYWDQLQTVINKAGFTNELDEIEFYREVKPAFARYIEYYSLLSEGLQFEPPLVSYPQDLQEPINKSDWDRANQRTLIQYWTAEEQRGNRFYHKHQAFLDYCESNNRENDANYFLSSVLLTQDGHLAQRRSHNRDTALFTVHEELLTTWHAYKLYSEFIQKKVQELITEERKIES